jgi:hypothetical protein
LEIDDDSLEVEFCAETLLMYEKEMFNTNANTIKNASNLTMIIFPSAKGSR